MIDHGTQLCISEGLRGTRNKETTEKHPMEQDSEHQSVLRSAGTTKPPLIFSEGDVDGGVMWQVDRLNSERIRNNDPPFPKRYSFPTSHALFVCVANASICIEEVFFLFMERFYNDEQFLRNRFYDKN